MSGALKEFEKSRKVTLAKKYLNPDVYEIDCQKEECPSLPKLIKENRENLAASNLGTLRSATAFLKILSAARTASDDELTKAFKGTKNKEILCVFPFLSPCTKIYIVPFITCFQASVV